MTPQCDTNINIIWPNCEDPAQFCVCLNKELWVCLNCPDSQWFVFEYQMCLPAETTSTETPSTTECTPRSAHAKQLENEQPAITDAVHVQLTTTDFLTSIPLSRKMLIQPIDKLRDAQYDLFMIDAASLNYDPK